MTKRHWSKRLFRSKSSNRPYSILIYHRRSIPNCMITAIRQRITISCLHIWVLKACTRSVLGSNLGLNTGSSCIPQSFQINIGIALVAISANKLRRVGLFLQTKGKWTSAPTATQASPNLPSYALLRSLFNFLIISLVVFIDSELPPIESSFLQWTTQTKAIQSYQYSLHV
jgi:hypothetical protein